MHKKPAAAHAQKRRFQHQKRHYCAVLRLLWSVGNYWSGSMSPGIGRLLTANSHAAMRGPDHTLPLRMQAARRQSIDKRLIAHRRALWRESVRKGILWRRAGRIGLCIGVVQMGLHWTALSLYDVTPTWLALVPLIAVPIVTFVAALLSAAATDADRELNGLRASRN